MSSTTAGLHSPLTTTFTPPATCTNSLAYVGTVADSKSYTRPLFQADYPQDSACFADGWTAPINDYALGQNLWSGPPVCPSGQTVAQQSTSGTMTTALCCSSGWGDGPGNVAENHNVLQSSSYYFYICLTTATATATTTVQDDVLLGGLVESSLATVTGPWAIYSTVEYLFVYNAATLSTTSSSAAASSMSSAVSLVSTTSVVSNWPSASPTPGTTIPDHTNALSGGTIAGICVGASAALILLGIGLWCFRSRRRGQRKMGERAQSPMGAPEVYETTTKSSYGSYTLARTREVAELPDAALQPRYELDVPLVELE